MGIQEVMLNMLKRIVGIIVMGPLTPRKGVGAMEERYESEVEIVFHSMRLESNHETYGSKIFEHFQNSLTGVAETLFDESSGQKKNHSEDPFGFYSLLNKNKDDTYVNGTEDEQSIKYPPGFTPEAENREFNLSEENVRSTNVENLKQGNDVEILDEQK
ncbi:hypothetical protein Tco_0217741 [Tanacetum coccineum]